MFATVVEGVPKNPFSIATTPRCRGGRSSFLLDCSSLLLIHTLYCWVLSKEVSSTIFKVFGMTRPGIVLRSPGPLANTLPTKSPNNCMSVAPSQVLWLKCFQLNFEIVGSRTWRGFRELSFAIYLYIYIYIYKLVNKWICNLLSFLLRCSTRPNEWSTQMRLELTREGLPV